MGNPKKILIVRTDRVGDVLLTTPVSTALKKHIPGIHVSWLVRSYTAPLLQHNPDVDQILTDDDQEPLIQLLKKQCFDTVLITLPRWRPVWAAFRAGITRRIGPASKIYALLFTDRVWQHRSRGEQNEADYNLPLFSPSRHSL